MKRPHRTIVAGFRAWRPFHLEVGKLHVGFGGISVKRGPFWVPDGLHLWWGRRYLNVFWSSGVGDTRWAHVNHGIVPEIPEPWST